MLRVYSCIAHQHNLLLVLVAALICLIASFVSLFAFQRAVREARGRFAFAGAAALVAGLGIWATHFVAMLAFEPGFAVTYDLRGTALSVVVAVVISGLGWFVALGKRPVMWPLGGAIIGAGIASMHYVGMSAVQVPGDIVWDRGLVAVSLALGIGLSAAAITLFRRSPLRRGQTAWAPGLLLFLAICCLHFIAMAAAVIYPRGGETMPPASVDNQMLAIVVTGAALLIMGVGSALVWLEQQISYRDLAQAQQRAAMADEILRGAEERDALMASLQRQFHITEAALDNMAQGLSMYDSDDRLVIFNRRYAQLYDIADGVLVPGMPFAEIRDHLVAAGIVGAPPRDGTPNAAKSGPGLPDNEVRLLNGRIIAVQRRPMPDGGWVATHDDVTETRRASQQIAFMAAHDTLTGLLNRASFALQLEACARDEASFAVHAIDLDRFKEVNDTLGHSVGDHILKAVANRLQEITDERDFIARLGGDEFAIIQLGIDKRAPAELAAGIVERLSEPFDFDGHTVLIGASVGIGRAPQDSDDGATLLKMSDLALYRAKEESRGAYRFFERGMDARLAERRQLEADLRTAIQEGQFEVHYQPVLDMTQGQIAAFEALVRWQHPVRGLIGPTDFIATAEETGLIIPIGEWVLRQACRDAADWPAHVRLAVNLSPAQFKRGDMIAMIVSALGAAGLDAHRLELEITESVLLHDEEWVRAVLNRLTDLGIGIAMDDFGTGYSSLSYLRAFPFTKIKIDRSFINDLLGTTDALSIVQATIQLSKKLGMAITAEGVETAEQMQLLAGEGCTQVQGFHISQAVAAQHVADLLSTYEGHAPLDRAVA